MYYYNSWDADFKQPFGAIQVGQIMKVNLQTDKENVTAKFIIRRDFGARSEFDMQKLEGGIFSAFVKFDVGQGLYYYYFEISEPTDWGIKKFYYGCSGLGGEGVLYMNENDVRPYQATIFSSKDVAPAWYREAVFYQIFPDRFHNGNPEGKINHSKPNSFIYATKEDTPLYVKDEAGDVVRWDFFGGNIRGIIEKIPYLKELGITALYLNPIFSATSNHRYDTNDYLQIDSMLGTEEDFQELVDVLHTENMRIVLDGVFSHVGKDSRYFNLSGQYGSDVGAAKNPDSRYMDWFKFTEYPMNYKSWWGIKDLPEVDKDNPSFRDFIYGDTHSVLAKWNQFGIDGWRLDVADELPDSFIRGIRKNLSRYPETILIGEVWEDASNKISYGQRRNYILGDSLQAVMNYPFRDLIIAYLTMTKTAQELAYQMLVLSENYPHDIFYNNFNNLGTHDTERILTMVGDEANDLAVGMLFSLPGVPCVYYGDEAGLTGRKDPKNRKYFPWDNIHELTYDLYHQWIAKRHSEKTLTQGKFTTFFQGDVLGILRYTDCEAFVYVINPTDAEVKLTFKEIHFLQKVSFTERLADCLDELILPAKSGQDFKIIKVENKI